VFDSSAAAAPGFIQCFIGNSNLSKVYVGSTNPFTGLFPLGSGANVVRITTTGTVAGCVADQAGLTVYQPMSVSVTKINSQTVKHPAPVGPKAGTPLSSR
jgi:hypothetical protein